MKRWTIALITVLLVATLVQLPGQPVPIGPLSALHISSRAGCESLANLVSSSYFAAASAGGFSLGPAIFNYREAQNGMGLSSGKVVFGPINAPQMGVRYLYYQVGSTTSVDNDFILASPYSNPRALPIGIMVDDAPSLALLEKTLRLMAANFAIVFKSGYVLEQAFAAPSPSSAIALNSNTHTVSLVFRSPVNVITMNFSARQLQPGGTAFGPLQFN